MLCIFICSVYEGEVLNGLRHGRGCFICANQKTVYTGQWKLGKRNGEGKLVYNLDDQSCCYEGHWVDNMKDGYGRMQYRFVVIEKLSHMPCDYFIYQGFI